jgi:Zn-dependent protease
MGFEKYMNKGTELVVPATSSGLGVTTGNIILNSIRGQAVLIETLLCNAIAITLFGIGCFAMAFGIGQILYQKKDTRKWGALTSYGTSSLANGILPFMIGSFMLDNAANYGGTLEAVANNYVSFMAMLGLIMLGVGALVIHEKVK